MRKISVLVAFALFSFTMISLEVNAKNLMSSSTAKVIVNPLQNIPITGVVEGGGSFVGTFTVQSFQLVGRSLAAVGTLTGTLTNAAGGIIGTVTNIPVTLPVFLTGGSCKILELDLGPLNLDLLGLEVDLSRVHLDITAQQGPGNLLGNLLCAVANLLNSNAVPNALTQLVGHLNRILGAL